MRFLSFTSGSCGNCYYLGDDDGGLLIDAGASMRRVKRSLMDNGLTMDAFGAILITHDHLDHIRFLGTFCKYHPCRVFATRKLHGVLASHNFTKDHIASSREVLSMEEWNEIQGFRVKCFEVPHDATQTVGYAIEKDGHLFVLMTDLEHVTPEAMEYASKAETVVLESNYDYDMLVHGPYPPELKERILNEGHLSNDDCAEAIRGFYHDSLKNLFLCHLSANNNTPSKAYDCAKRCLDSLGVAEGTVYLRTLERGKPSPLFTIW